MRSPGWRRVAALLLLVGATFGWTGPAAAPTVWPPPGISWQWQLTTPVDLSVSVAVYDIDLFDNDASVVVKLHAPGRKAICYLSAGSWENWRPAALAGRGGLTLHGRATGQRKPIQSYPTSRSGR